ncbi:hypothetical protein IFM89_022368 [Coptis chinensis]|uniref:Protein kinase domain-containing protein n=1 Tax=Coptis chinensis TaxID=261450 RepID=A0A835LBH5_9MAGN|nr:hypothetical protein IFM89_022368 [Coptis chinensis]
MNPISFFFKFKPPTRPFSNRLHPPYPFPTPHHHNKIPSFQLLSRFLFFVHSFPPPRFQFLHFKQLQPFFWLSSFFTMTSRKLLHLLFITFFFLKLNFPSCGEAAEDFSFDFASFSLRNLTLLGDSYLRNGVVGLTRELGVPSSSSGSVLCTTPIPFFDPETNISASFSTRFSFSITNASPGSFGDGLAFFLSSDSQTLGSSGGYLGLVNSSQLTKNKFFAIEFDTRLDALFNDPNDNHIGLDLESLISIQTADVSSRGIDLKSGNSITAWIDYDNIRKALKVWMSYSSFKPDNPVLSVEGFDLSKYYQEFMFVGFSASTEGSTERHLIEEWTFRTRGLQSLIPRRSSHPHNVSDNSVSTSTSIPVIPIPSSSNNKRKKLGLGLGLAGPAFVCLALVVFGWISVKKLKKANADNSFKPELLNSPRQFPYTELKEATKGFHSSRILGYGSFGTVYKAVCTQSGATFAVKRSKHTHEGKTEFIAELSIIACLRHKNLVQLQGWCCEKGELLLVYEYMPNGSLDKKMVNLVDWVWGLHSEGNLIEAADKRLNREFVEEGMIKLLLVGLSCANPSSTERPSIRRVLQILNSEAELLSVPKTKPSLTFSSSLPLSIEDIVSDCEKSESASPEKSVKASSPSGKLWDDKNLKLVDITKLVIQITVQIERSVQITMLNL